MKLLIRLSLLLFSIQSFGNSPFYITHKNNLNEALRIKEILSNQFQIPKRFIQIKSFQSPCSKDSTRLVHICIPKPHKYIVIGSKPVLLKRSFSIFQKGFGSNVD